MNNQGSRVSGLRMENKTKSTRCITPPKRGWSFVFIFTLVIVLVAIFIIVGKDSFLPAAEVYAVPALAVKSQGDFAAPEEPAFQAAGWVEPAPLPVQVTALVGGVVKKVYVIEGSPVKKGQLLAEMIDEDLKLALKGLEAQEKHIEMDILEAESEYRAAQAEVKHHQSRIETEQRKLAKLVNLSDRLKKAGDVVPELEPVQAELDVKIQKAIIEEIKSERNLLVAAEKVALANLSAARIKLKPLEAEMDKIKLAISRTKIYAPIDGIVMRLLARVGSKRIFDSDNMDSSSIAELYEPDKLQVRVDVPLADAGGLSVGQKTRITVEILPDKTFQGIVTSIVGQADINRNTLQAKVKILNPSSVLRPEMLAKVQFLSVRSTENSNDSNIKRLRIFIPERGLHNRQKAAGSVWVVDRISNTLKMCSVQVGQNKGDGWLEIRSGLKAGKLVVVSDAAGLEDGMRVRINNSGEE